MAEIKAAFMKAKITEQDGKWKIGKPQAITKEEYSEAAAKALPYDTILFKSNKGATKLTVIMPFQLGVPKGKNESVAAISKKLAAKIRQMQQQLTETDDTAYVGDIDEVEGGKNCRMVFANNGEDQDESEIEKRLIATFAIDAKGTKKSAKKDGKSDGSDSDSDDSGADSSSKKSSKKDAKKSAKKDGKSDGSDSDDKDSSADKSGKKSGKKGGKKDKKKSDGDDSGSKDADKSGKKGGKKDKKKSDGATLTDMWAAITQDGGTTYAAKRVLSSFFAAKLDADPESASPGEKNLVVEAFKSIQK